VRYVFASGGRKAEDPFKGIEGWAGFLPPATFRRFSPNPSNHIYRGGGVFQGRRSG